MEMASLSRVGRGNDEQDEDPSSRVEEGEVESKGLLGHDSAAKAGSLPKGAEERAAFLDRLGGVGRRSGSRCRSSRCWNIGVTAFALFLVGVIGASVLPWIILHEEAEGNNQRQTGVVDSAVPSPRDKTGWRKYHDVLKAKAKEEAAGVNVLLVGDSITEEMLDTNLGKRSDWGADHEEQISVWKKYYEPLGALNLGVSGDETQHVLWRLRHGELPAALKPQSIMVAIGTNNLGNGRSPQDTVEGIKAIVNFLLEVRPDALIRLMALFPRAEVYKGSDNTPWPAVDEVNQGVHRVLEADWGGNVRFIDCNEKFLTTDDAGKTILNSEVIASDNLHLTVAGLTVWAECAAADIKLGLKEKVPET